MNRRVWKNRHMLDFFFVLCLFTAFALSSLLLVTVGAGVYRKTQNASVRNFTARTASSYLTEKLRQADVCSPDSAPAVSLCSFGDGNALVFAQTAGTGKADSVKKPGEPAQELLLTYIYFYDGSLRELNCREGAGVGPEAGRELLPLQQFTIEKPSASLYRFTLTDEEGFVLSFLAGTHSYGVGDPACSPDAPLPETGERMAS